MYVHTSGQLAEAGRVNRQTLRFYERQGILRPDARSDSGYRLYSGDSLKRLVFIRQAKELGFSLREIKDLLSWRVRTVESCGRVRKKAAGKLGEVREKIRKLKVLERTLEELIDDCEKRVVSDCCPILARMENRTDAVS